MWDNIVTTVSAHTEDNIRWPPRHYHNATQLRYSPELVRIHILNMQCISTVAICTSDVRRGLTILFKHNCNGCMYRAAAVYTALQLISI